MSALIAQLGTVEATMAYLAGYAAAVEAILAKLAAAQHPVATVTQLTRRYGVTDKAVELLTKADLPVALTPNDKGTLDESLPQYLGLYSAASSQPPAVRDIVENADVRKVYLGEHFRM